MAARVNDVLFKPGFDLSTVAYDDVGTLYDGHKCEPCGAKLSVGEVKKSKSRRGKMRGGTCCSDGAVELPPVSKLERLEEPWTNQTDPCATLLRELPRNFNNTLALAYEEVLEPDLGDASNGQPSLVIQGKMYHRVGPLSAEENRTKAFAQLHVHDPAAADDVAEQRLKWMYMPQGTSERKKQHALNLLLELQTALKDNNTYVADFANAGDIFNKEDVVDRQFVIDPTKRPHNTHERCYNDHTFHEVSVLMLEANGGKAPKRSAKVRDREGGLHDIDETHRAFDPLHFVLLFPLGDDGWRPGLQLRPKGAPPDANFRRWDARASGGVVQR
jgi:hypothetical protein